MPQRNSSIKIEIEEGDVTVFPTEVLVLKHAQGLFGADQEVVDTLEGEGLSLQAQLPPDGEVLLVASLGHIEAEKILFVGVKSLYEFGYQDIRDFARRALEALSVDVPETQYVALTVHGVNYGLDEFEAFEAEIAGLVDAITEYKFPLDLEYITFVERDAARADRLRDLLQDLLPNGCIESRRGTFAEDGGEARADRLRSAGYSTESKPHIFVAMPFAPEMQDTYDYGIVGAARAAGFVCERADLSAFTGDVLAWVKRRIKSASLVVADLTTANPNVYLEVGYAWGCGVPTVLLVRDTQELKFDVQMQRCIVYRRIKELEENLAKALEALREGLGIYTSRGFR
jgi:hypothetical protein